MRSSGRRWLCSIVSASTPRSRGLLALQAVEDPVPVSMIGRKHTDFDPNILANARKVVHGRLLVVATILVHVIGDFLGLADSLDLGRVLLSAVEEEHICQHAILLISCLVSSSSNLTLLEPPSRECADVLDGINHACWRSGCDERSDGEDSEEDSGEHGCC